MTRLQKLVSRGLEQTAHHWPAIRRAYRWVHQAARLLNNDQEQDAATVRRRYRSLLGAMARHREKAGELLQGVDHFLKVTRSYWPGLFHCYEVSGLPRTNNQLEQLFGSHRYHQRRATGRHAASPMLVARGQVQLVAATSTRLNPPAPVDLQPRSLHDWRTLRRQLDQRCHRRTQRTRFRRDPTAFLAQLEHQLIQSALPA